MLHITYIPFFILLFCFVQYIFSIFLYVILFTTKPDEKSYKLTIIRNSGGLLT